MASNLIGTSDLEVHVQSGLPSARLEEIIDGADAEIVRLAGPHDGSRKVILRADISRTITLPSPAESISEVKEWSDGILEANGAVITDYQAVGGGRSLRKSGGNWRRNVAVTYTPQADNARRVQVLIDLVIWELARSGHTRERVGQYETYQGKESERGQILGRLRQRYAGAGLLA